MERPVLNTGTTVCLNTAGQVLVSRLRLKRCAKGCLIQGKTDLLTLDPISSIPIDFLFRTTNNVSNFSFVRWEEIE